MEGKSAMRKAPDILILLVALAYISPAHGLIERMEPPNWWSGMKNPQLQILLYGQNIAQYNPVVDGGGVHLQSVTHVDNPNYLFIYLDISQSIPGEMVEISLMRDGIVRQTVNYPILNRETGSAERKGFDGSDAIYLITPDRFANGNPANDEVSGMAEGLDRTHESGRHGGDLEGVIRHLDYIEKMGFTAIWLNPVLENDMERAYHGYATTDFYKVDPRFGSNDLYRNFIGLAEERGIKIIMDMILNHAGSGHWFVKDPPTSDWINFGGEYVNTNHMRRTVQDIHASEHDKRMFADGWFVRTMPDLNQRNKLLADYLVQNTIWWIEYAGLRGIRMDTYPYPDKDFMSRWTREVLQEYPDFNIVGEEWSEQPAIVSYWQRGKMNHDGYVSSLPSLMDFPLQAAVRACLTENDLSYRDPFLRMYEALALDFLYPDPLNLVIFPDNHDMARFYTQVNEDLSLFKMGIIYFLTMRGIPQIYYGTEILMDSSADPGNHGLIRSDFPGGWDGDTVNAFTGDGLTRIQLETQAFLKTLLNWRKGKPVLHEGELMHYAPQESMYVYFRYNELDAVMVVLNRGDSSRQLELRRFNERLEGYLTARDVLSGEVHGLKDYLSIPARCGLVLDLD